MSNLLVLASGSPQRKQLLESLGYSFSILAPNIDESRLPGEDVFDFVARLAEAKAAAVRDEVVAGSVVVGADSVVVVAGEVLGKPTSADDASRMLNLLSDTTHQVLTGYCVTNGQRSICDVAETKVTFRKLTDAEISWYVESGEPFGGAGACRIQGRGAAFVESIVGSFSNVVGLPLSSVFVALASFGIAPDAETSS